MFNQTETQRTRAESIVDDYLLTWVEAFLIDRKARGLSEGTLKFYQAKLKLFCEYADSQVVSKIHHIKPTLIRQFLLFLEETRHNEGGRHAAISPLRRVKRAPVRFLKSSHKNDL